MKVLFSGVGRGRRTFTRNYPIEVPLDILSMDYAWLARQVRGALMSEPDFDLAPAGSHIAIFAGFHPVGEITIVQEEGTDNGN